MSSRKDATDERTEKDMELAEQAEREAEAQLAIVRALKPLSGGARGRVLSALGHVLSAEELVPGIFESLAMGVAARRIERRRPTK